MTGPHRILVLATGNTLCEFCLEDLEIERDASARILSRQPDGKCDCCGVIIRHGEEDL